MSAADALKMIQENKVKFVDFRFTDTRGKEQHVSVPANVVQDDTFEEGKMFDGSSIAGWKGINESDMILMPDPDTAVVDPFMQDTTVLLRCDVIEPTTMQGYERDPRSIAKRGEAYLKSTGIGDAAFFGPEAEFFIFDSVRWTNEMSEASYHLESVEAAWSSGKEYEDGNIGHRPGVKGGYFPVPPVDSLQDVRSAMCLAMADMGLDVEVHHHEVGTAGQGEIGTRFDTLVAKADQLQIYKYCVHNVAHAHGLTATFMPKPLVGDNGSGMHVHQSVFKNGDNMFAGDEYGGLSESALYYIGGIFKHARSLNAFTNASTNSYKRLVPGFEAPVMLAYSARNRSASCRIPYDPNPKSRRVEVRFPDATANPYLAFTAMMMAGLDGIQNKLHPGESLDKDLYDLPPEEEKGIATVAHSLDVALEALDSDREYLKAGGVMTNDMIDAYIELKSEEVQRLLQATHPVEFDMYYSV
ncbi:MAG TPA: glutamate--ammonia ligase [Arenicellales bacterium]|jgi:glutamine synthetase|nr:glutamine synthetase [Acidiferrobacteraceae bacterium]MDP6137187.1 glutamate--ammonia ligase [Arenicellales bacterium]MDP7219205.1 glutamate--ammonia ligase [Arenicellales bacterium]HCF74006.1 glutamine synthetase [Gammaproteobacteria bacterium]HJP10582.1 glutamate--ammonia ligase [Arenicellales bacterium]|tara:strand:- start:1141 stop:2550 length:1410 start_codon:yes stop_codon:yes gene_type:complete